MSVTKLYSKSGKLKGTVTEERYFPINSREDYYAADKQDYIAKMEQGDLVWDEKANEFTYSPAGTVGGPKVPPTFFTVRPLPETLEGLHAVSHRLMDGHILSIDERRDGRTKVADAHIVLVDSKGFIGGYSLDNHYVLTEPGRYKAEFAEDLVRGKEYIFYSPEGVYPKGNGRTTTGQWVTYQNLLDAIDHGERVSIRAVGPIITKPAAIQCLWAAFGGRALQKLTAGDKGVYLNTAVNNVFQIAFLVAAGYKLYLRISAADRRKDYFAVKGS